ncbi:hypothetical protein [Paraburkholderia caribensis]|uniref:hypothetical protein n=1 Tax=Paraburkholderia caribensis TaxID=75105 RepID=UPI0015909A10|nr:hypothetical protein [Paraburkholderia caribensis]
MSFLQEIHRAHRAADYPHLTISQQAVFDSYVRARVGRDRVNSLAFDELAILSSDFERHIRKLAQEVPHKRNAK